MSNKKHIKTSVIWQKLSGQNRVYFWSIFSTGLVGLFSLWLGVTIQDDINTKNAKETQKLARYQMVQTVYPKFSQYMDTCADIFFDLWEIYNSPLTKKDKSIATHILRHYYDDRHNEFAQTLMNSVNFMCDNRYFFNRSVQAQICANNTSILFGLKLLGQNNTFLNHTIENWPNNASLRDSVSAKLNNAYYAKNTFLYKKEAEEQILKKCRFLLQQSERCDSTENVENVLYNFLFIPFMDNFNVYQNELMPNDEVNSHLGKHSILLFVCVLFTLIFCHFLMRHVFKPLHVGDDNATVSSPEPNTST